MNYLENVKKNFNEWNSNGYCEEARKLNELVGVKYFDETNPQYFTGDINSKLVLVHLNPKRNTDSWNVKSHYDNFEDYNSYYSKFGKNKYGIDSDRTHKSKFDHKQIRFLKPFRIIQFKNNDVYHNLEAVIDQKLQIELVPFGSPDFNYKEVGIENLTDYIERLLELISSQKREYVIFCGKVFEDLLSKHIISQKNYRFTLDKKDQTKAKTAYTCSIIEIEFKGKKFRACIAPQYAKQGCPLENYGKQIYKRYYPEDESLDSMHLEMMENKNGQFATVKSAYTTYLKMGYSKEKALQQSGMNSFLKKNPEFSLDSNSENTI